MHETVKIILKFIYIIIDFKSMKKIFLFSLFAVGFLLFIPGNVLAWTEPSCAPPGCNRPQPITVEGGTINSGSSLIIQGTDANTVIDQNGIKLSGKISGDEATKDFIDDLGLTVVTCEGDDGGIKDGGANKSESVDPADDPLVICQLEDFLDVENAYIDHLLVANKGILLGEGQSIYGIAGANNIQINEGSAGSWGYGILSQAHSVGGTTASNDTIGVWGKAAISVDDEYSYGIYGQGSGYNTYGVYATNSSQDSYALVASNSHISGGAAYFVGDIVADGGSTIINIDHYYSAETSEEREFIVTSTFADADGIGTEYIPIKVKSTEPNRVYFGEESTSDIEICLNDGGNGQQCISSWDDVASAQTTGNKLFKTISTPLGTSPEADNASDALSFYSGNNISITGDSANDSVTFSIDSTLNNIIRVNSLNNSSKSTESPPLILDGPDATGVYIYDKLTVDGEGGVTIIDGELCIGETCITELQLQSLLLLIK
jgi:hypothetical protein